MRLKRAQIDWYQAISDVLIDFAPSVHIIKGENEAGKTLLLEGLLELLESGALGLGPGWKRVEESPAGHLVLETADGERKFDGSLSLSEITPLEPIDLVNLFVIRDSDLKLPKYGTVFEKVNERIGNMNTTALNRIEDALEDRGRLTTGQHRLRNTKPRKTKDTRNAARELTENITKYLDGIADEGIPDTEKQRLRLQTRLRSLRTEKEELEAAQTLAKHDRLQGRLETVKTTTSKLTDYPPVSEEDYEQLRTLKTQAKSHRKTADNEEEKQSGMREEVAELKTTRNQVVERRDALLENKGEAETLLAETRAVGEKERPAEAWSRELTLAKATGVIGLVVGGLGAVVGFTLHPSIPTGAFILVIVGLLGIGAWIILHRAQTAREQERDGLLREGELLGFDAKTIPDLIRKLEGHLGELEKKNTRASKLKNTIESKEDQIQHHEKQAEEEQSNAEEKENKISSILDKVGSDSIEVYGEKLAARGELTSRRSKAAQSLIDEFGEPDEESWQGKISAWEDKLEALEAEVHDEEISAGNADSDRLEEVGKQLGDIEDELASAKQRLEDHRKRLRDFDRQAREINGQTFGLDPLSLPSENIDGAEALARHLDEVVATIDEKADVARAALSLVDDARSEEQEKMEDLFETDGRASSLFREITDNDYIGVEFDPDVGEHGELQAVPLDGEPLEVHKLSQSTYDALFLSARIALCEKLLGGEQGLLLLDDAFLSADPDRLQRGFDVLEALGEVGWQVIYFSAKGEVWDSIGEKRGLPMDILGAE